MAPRASKRKLTRNTESEATVRGITKSGVIVLGDDSGDDAASHASDITKKLKLECEQSACSSSSLAVTAPPEANVSAAVTVVSFGEDCTAPVSATQTALAGENGTTMSPSNILKIITWNVAGIRAASKKTMPKFIQSQDPDIICFTEVKALKEENPFKPPGYHIYWNASFAKKGYSGVGLFSKVPPLKVEYGIGHSCDDEGRCIVAEYEQFKLVLCYTPNAGDGLKTLPKRMQWDAQFLTRLKQHATDRSGKPLIVTGDLNCAHLDFDVYDGERNKKRVKHACFTPEERTNFNTLINDLGLIDVYRKLYPDERENHFTFFSHRGGCKQKNAGWRLDYFLTSPVLSEKVLDVQTCRDESSSDHVPLILTLKK